jgi:hypothetical protein
MCLSFFANADVLPLKFDAFWRKPCKQRILNFFSCSLPGTLFLQVRGRSTLRGHYNLLVAPDTLQSWWTYHMRYEVNFDLIGTDEFCSKNTPNEMCIHLTC